MTNKTTLNALRKVYLGRLAPTQASPNARQFFVGVITEADMSDVGLDPADRVAAEREVMDGCLKDALLVRDLVLERGKEGVQPMGMVTPAGLEWVQKYAGEGG
ncbi:MAG: hypothetical protein AAF291_16680 [Pseudomonadota bacterium]